jgi:hypothetical protein
VEDTRAHWASLQCPVLRNFGFDLFSVCAAFGYVAARRAQGLNSGCVSPLLVVLPATHPHVLISYGHCALAAVLRLKCNQQPLSLELSRPFLLIAEPRCFEP